MSLTIGIVGLLSLIALFVVGAAAFVEVRPVVTAHRARRRRLPAPEDTLRVYPPARYARPRESRMAGATVSLLLGLALVAAGAWEWSHFGFQTAWPATEGAILDAWTEPAQPESAGPRAVVQYRYVVGEQAFVGQWAESQQTLLTGFIDGDALLALYRRGEPITVWYHPLLPNFPSLGQVSLWYVAVIFSLGGLLVARALASLLARLRVLALNGGAVGSLDGPPRIHQSSRGWPTG